ncbi:MAG: hypothetical protein WKF79_06330 [Nocardioides sp.]
MSESKPTRPRQVTLAAGLIMGGSLVVVLTAFDRVANLRTLDSRRGVEEFLAKPPGDGLGLDVEDVLSAIQVLSMVAGACAAATAILGFQLLQRSRGARLALGIIAVPLFVSGIVTAGFMASMVAAAVAMLWFQPARDWFDGIVREPVSRPAPAPRGPADQATPPSPVTLVPPPRPDTRPAPLLWACGITWTFCGLAIVGLGISVAVLATAPDLLFDELNRQNSELADQGMTNDEITSATYATSAVLIVWCAAAIGFAAAAFSRRRWGRSALLVSTAIALALCLAATLASFVMVLPLIAAVVTVSLLLRPETRAWF